jgi:hypothetical protein
MSQSKKWSLCLKCPPPAYLPAYIKNPALYSGTTNNPASLVTNSMKYSHKVTTRSSGQVTKIYPVKQRIIAPLVNPLP